MGSKVENLIEEFKNTLNNENDYSLKDYSNILQDCYKKVYGGKKDKKKSESGEKKPPSVYNLFIKEEIARIKLENLNVPPNEYMKIAAERWKLHKSSAEKKVDCDC